MPEQWNAPTLCARWRVRDVVAHVISYDELRTRDLLGRVIGSRLDAHRVNAAGVTDLADRRPEELLALLEAHLDPKAPPQRSVAWWRWSTA